MLDLNRLAGFRLVASEGGYAKAARAAPYPITQPALHQQVRKLEAEVGVALLERVGKDTMRPTPAGARLLELVEPFLRELPRVVGSLRTGAFTGTLTIAAEPLLIRRLLPQWLAALRRRQPKVRLSVLSTPQADLGLLRSGKADVLLCHLPETPADIAADQVAVAYACLVVPKARGLTRSPQALASLADLPFLSYPALSRPQALQLQALAEAGASPTDVITLESADTMLGYVEAGLGWSLVPSLDPEGPKGRLLTAYPWGKPRQTFAIAMAWRKDAPEHPMLDAMLACAP